MATRLYIRDKASNGISGYRDLVTTAGSSSTTGVVDTDGSTEKQWTKTSGGAVMAWISGRSPSGGWTLDGVVSFSIWAHESATSANAGARVRLFKRTAAGVETEIAGPFDDGVEFTKTTPTEMTWTGDPASTAFAENDRLVVKFYITNVGAMGTGQTCTLTYDAAEAATGDSQITLTETVAFKAEVIERTPADTGAVAEFRKAVVSPLAPHPTQTVSVSDSVTRQLFSPPLARNVFEAITAADAGNFPVLEEEYAPGSPLTGSAGGVNWTSQTLPGESGYSLAGVSLLAKLENSAGTNTITVSLRTVDGEGKPTGPDLASVTTAPGHLDASTFKWIFFPLSYALTGGTQYSIVFRSTPFAANQETNVLRAAFTIGGYASGAMWTSTDAGATWSGGTLDSSFRAYSGPSPIQISRLKASVGGNWFVNNGITRVVDAVTAVIAGGAPLTAQRSEDIGVTDAATAAVSPLVCSVSETVTAQDAGNFPTLDVSFAPSGNSGIPLGGISLDCQTFPSGAGFTMVGASVAINNTAGTGYDTNTINLCLRAVDGDDHPTGPDLVACTLALKDIASNGFPLIYFPLPYTLAPATQYALFLRVTPFGSSWQFVVNWKVAISEYPDGSQWGTGDLGETWSGGGIADLGFRVYSGTASPIQVGRLKASVGGNWFVNNGVVTVTDSVAATVTATLYKAEPAESITVADETTAVLTGAAPLTASVSEAAAVTDFFVSGVVTPLAVHAAEAATATDSAKAALQLGRRPAEAVTAADVATVAVQLGLRLAETLAALENLKVVASPLAVHASQSITVADASDQQATGAGALERSVSETITATDAAHPAIPLISSTLAEAISALDSAAKSTARAEVGSQAILAVVELDGTNAEAWVGSQAILIVLELFPDASVSDAIAIVDAVTAALAAGPAARSVSDAITVSEFLKGIRTPLAVHAAEAISAVDVVTAGGNRTANVADAVAVSEFLKAVRSPLAVHAADAASATDAATVNLPLGRAVSVAIAVTEFAKAVRTLGRVLTDAVAGTDSADPQLTSVGALARSVSEQIQATDFVKVAVSLAAKREELIAVSDAASASVSPLVALLSEAIAVAEFVQQASELRLDLAETAAVLDAVFANVAALPSFEAAPFETVAVTDDVAALVAFDYASRGQRRIFETPAEASASGSRIFEMPAEPETSGSRIFGTTPSGTPRIFDE